MLPEGFGFFFYVTFVNRSHDPFYFLCVWLSIGAPVLPSALSCVVSIDLSRFGQRLARWVQYRVKQGEGEGLGSFAGELDSSSILETPRERVGMEWMD